MLSIKFSLLLWLALIGGGCSLAKVLSNNPQAQQSAPTQIIPKDTVITLERTGCNGSCPIYKLRISADGSLAYDGQMYVKTKGIVRSTVSQEQLRQLISEFEKAKYFSLRDSYVAAPDGCPTNWKDNPSAITSVQMEGKKKSISHYYGCREQGVNSLVYPQELYKLESRIDEIVNSKQWIE